MLHLVFNETAVPVLQAAMALDDSLQAEILLITDDYAMGPIDNIYVAQGADARKEWWQNFSAVAHPDKNLNDLNDWQTMANLVGTLRRNETETVWVWAAQNAKDVCGYYFILHYLKEFQGRIFILYLNNLPFINEKGSIFYPQTLAEIPASEFLKAKKLAREITPSELEVDPDEWIKLSKENGGIRLLEGGKKLKSEAEDFFDADLKKLVTADWQKAAKIISAFTVKFGSKVSEGFLLYRLKQMAAQGAFNLQGKTETKKDFEIKLAD